MKKISFYPSSVYEFRAEQSLLSKVIQPIENLDWRKNIANSFSSVSDLYNYESFKEIHEWFGQCVKELASDLSFLNVEGFTITQSWANKTLKNQSHHLHSHPKSFISGVFYLTDCAQGDGGETFFYTKNIPIWYHSLFMERHDDVISILPQSGKLILFPSHLLHNVAMHNSDTPRYTIAFNVFPNGKCGSPESLEFLNIKTEGFSIK